MSTADHAARSPLAPALLLMIASGFAGLGYQIVWTQQFALWLGHEAPAVIAVVAAFFGGIACGAWVLGPRVERSARPQRAYALCEVVVAVWAVLLAATLAPVTDAMLRAIGAEAGSLRQWSIAFGGAFLLLLPATAAMGATLPAMARVVARRGGAERRVAALYAANTAGATLGVFVTAFWTIPDWGLLRTAWLCAALNLACAGIALRLAVPAARAPERAPGQAIPWLYAATGLLGIGYEVVVVRVLSQVAEDTVYTFALLLAVYLLGTAAGAAAYRRVRTTADDATLRNALLVLQSTSCLAGVGSLWGAEWVRDGVARVLGGGLPAALGAEAALAAAAFLLPTLLMGALFAHLCHENDAAGRSLGRALASNTAGAALAPPLLGVGLVAACGPKLALLAIAAGYLLLALPGALRMRPYWAPAVALGALAVYAPPLAFVEVPPGGHVRSYREGALAAVSVVEDAEGVSRLRINNRQQEGSSATRYSDARQALIPMLLHARPTNALFLGLGTGVTASAAAAEAGVSVDAVELLPEVIEASALFVADGDPRPRPRLVSADARRYVRSVDRRYDVVVADNFHPARAGSGALYTVEHFRAVRARLAIDGVFCQWLPLHQLDLATLRTIVASFLRAFPHGSAVLATHSLDTPVVGLVARADDRGFRLDEARRRLAEAAYGESTAAFGIGDEYALLGTFFADAAGLARFAGDAPLNTDDRPVVAYRAPRATYVPESSPRDRLLTLLVATGVRPEGILAPDADPSSSERLARYWAARSRFVAVGAHVRPSGDPQRMLAQVEAPLLGVLELSADFRPAYDPLLRLALAIAAGDPQHAGALLTKLEAVQPARPEAAEALAEFGARAIPGTVNKP